MRLEFKYNDKYNVITTGEFAKANAMSTQAVHKLINHDKVDYIEIGTYKFIVMNKKAKRYAKQGSETYNKRMMKKRGYVTIKDKEMLAKKAREQKSKLKTILSIIKSKPWKGESSSE